MSTFRSAALGLLAATMALPQAAAASDDLVRGILGLGTAIYLNEMQKNQQAKPQRARPQKATRQRATPDPRESEARAARMEVQRRLNALGFDAGAVDGAYGPRTRGAIAAFQRSIGHRDTGRISEEEIAILYSRSASVGESGGEQGFEAYTGYPAQSAPMPPVGAVHDGSGAATAGGFPAIGAPDPGDNAPQAGAAATGFPSIGAPKPGGEATAPGAAAAGFPKIGAPGAEAPAAGGEFPAFGEPASAPDDSGEAMPALGGAPELESGAFPAFATGAEPAPVGAPMPALASPDMEPDKKPMPTLGASPALDEAGFPDVTKVAPLRPGPAMPTLGAPGEDATGESVVEGDMVGPDEETTLPDEIARTDYGTADAQPSVRGISLGQMRDEVDAALEAMGFSGCDRTEGRLGCARETGSFADSLAIWSDTAGASWAIMRRIAFSAPAPADIVREQLHASYPELMAAAGGMVASRAACTSDMLEMAHLNTALEAMAAARVAEGTVPEALLDFARRCPLVYRLEVEEADSDAIATTTIAFIDATGLIALARARGAEEKKAEDARREKLADDLKL